MCSCAHMLGDLQVYAPAEHKEDTVHESLEEGERLEEEGKDEPPSWAQDLHKKA